MRVPLTVADFLDRAETGFAEATAVVDEPSQPAPTVPTTSYGELARRARAWQAGLDALGVHEGERVAVVSHNSARLMELLHAVPASGRICVPVNFRLHSDEVNYIVEHSGASVLLVDPELDEPLKGVNAPQRFVLGGETDEQLMRFDTEPRPWSEPDEDATATINYTSGTTARPKGVKLTHRNIWINAVTFAMHTRAWERDVYLHTLPMFHCNGWGMPYGLVGLGARQVVIRKIDGARDPAPGRRARRDADVRCARGLQRRARRRGRPGRARSPATDTLRLVCAGAAPPAEPIHRVGHR